MQAVAHSLVSQEIYLKYQNAPNIENSILNLFQF